MTVSQNAQERDVWMRMLRHHAGVHDVEEYYTFGPVLGQGRFSTVREAVSKSTNKKYAVRRILFSYTS